MPSRRAVALVRTNRLEAMSDGTFAIVITLLVLEIHRPAASPGRLAHELLTQWPAYVGYAGTFVLVGVIWINHMYLFSQLTHTDAALNWINLVILGATSLLPFPTGVLAGAFGTHNIADQRTAIVLYAAVAILASIVWIPLFLHLRHNRGMHKNGVEPHAFTMEILRPIAGCVGYIVGAALGWWHPLCAVAVFTVVIAYYAATSRGLRALRIDSLRSDRQTVDA